MSKLKLAPLPDDKPVKVTITLSAEQVALLAAYGAAVGSADGKPPSVGEGGLGGTKHLENQTRPLVDAPRRGNHRLRSIERAERDPRDRQARDRGLQHSGAKPGLGQHNRRRATDRAAHGVGSAHQRGIASVLRVLIE